MRGWRRHMRCAKTAAATGKATAAKRPRLRKTALAKVLKRYLVRHFFFDRHRLLDDLEAWASDLAVFLRGEASYRQPDQWGRVTSTFFHGAGRGVDQGVDRLLAAEGARNELLAAAGPDQGERLAVLDQIGVDRSGEARVVEFDREVVAPFVGALRPGGADLSATNVDPMAGSVVARPVGIGDDADALALQAQGDDFALELVAGLLEGADICHVTSPWLFEPATIAASMAICRPKAIDDAPSLGRSAAEDGGGETFLLREEWANRGPRALARGVARPGEESLAAAIAAEAIEA